MYTAELQRHKKEKEEWRSKAERLEDRASALQVRRLTGEPAHGADPAVLTSVLFSHS